MKKDALKHGEHRQVPKPRKNIEMKICGIHACEAVFAKRPQDIIRAYVTEAQVKKFSKLLKYCAEKKLAYRVISEEEIAKVSEATHHEGVCLLVKRIPPQTYQDFLNGDKEGKAQGCIVALENVQNPHNLGAILRVCAHFGVQGVLVSSAATSLSGASYRTSEGGAEWVKVITTDDFVKAMEAFRKKGYVTFSTSSHTGKSLFSEKMPKKSVIFFGSENEGLSTALLKASDKVICIPNTGHVESLNVACAASSILTEYYRVNLH